MALLAFKQQYSRPFPIFIIGPRSVKIDGAIDSSLDCCPPSSISIHVAEDFDYFVNCQFDSINSGFCKTSSVVLCAIAEAVFVADFFEGFGWRRIGLDWFEFWIFIVGEVGWYVYRGIVFYRVVDFQYEKCARNYENPDLWKYRDRQKHHHQLLLQKPWMSPY